MEIVNLTNCCYPANQSLTYNINVDLILQNGVPANSQLTVLLNPGQNIQGEVNRYLSTQYSSKIFYTTYNLIQKV